MDSPNDFDQMILRVRAGDEQAAADLVKRYEAEIRLEVRVWLRTRHPGLRRAFDSLDICQAVLGSFFSRAAAGQYDLHRPEQLIRLLIGMARKKVAEQIKYQQRQRRDIRRLQSVGPEHSALTSDVSSPSDLVAGAELLDEFRRRLSPEERLVADLRAEGREWSDIAAQLGGTSDGRRKQLARAVERVLRELGLDE